MAHIVDVSDLSHPGLDVFARLTEAQLRNRREPEKGVFIAESPNVIAAALNAGCVPVSLLMERRHITGAGADIIGLCGDIPVYTGDEALLAQLTGYALTRGILCAMKRPALPPAPALLEKARRVAVLENIVDPTNVGALFRCAAALGMDAVLVTPACCDPLHRRSARVSMGGVFQIPWTRLEGWPEEGLTLLREYGFVTAAMALTDNSLSIDDPGLAAHPRLALVLGTEGDGLAPNTIAGCDVTVKIPMAHGVDSLNVGAAGAVAFWQLSKKRIDK